MSKKDDVINAIQKARDVLIATWNVEIAYGIFEHLIARVIDIYATKK